MQKCGIPKAWVLVRLLGDQIATFRRPWTKQWPEEGIKSRAVLPSLLTKAQDILSILYVVSTPVVDEPYVYTVGAHQKIKSSP